MRTSYDRSKAQTNASVSGNTPVKKQEPNYATFSSVENEVLESSTMVTSTGRRSVLPSESPVRRSMRAEATKRQPKEEHLEDVLQDASAPIGSPEADSGQDDMQAQLAQSAFLAKMSLEEKKAGNRTRSKSLGSNKANKKSSNKFVWVLAILGIVAVLIVTVCILLSTGVISLGEKETTPTTAYTEPTTTAYEPQLPAIEEDLLVLYTDELKSDLVEGVTSDRLEEFFVRLSKAASSGEDTSSVVSELNTISSYLSDSERLSQYESAAWDIVPEGFYNELMSLKEAADLYTVEGLKDTVHLRVDTLLEERETYFSVKEMLLSDLDLLYFDGSLYRERINGFSHTNIKEEMLLLLAKVEADSGVVVAEEALKTAEGVEAATAELSHAKETQQDAEKAWLMYIGEWVEENSEPVSESSNSSEVTEE